MNIWIDALNGMPWSELLRFTVTENDCCDPGDRVPAIFVHSDGFIYVTSHVGTNANFPTNVPIKLKTWMRVEIKQYPENGEVKHTVQVAQVWSRSPKSHQTFFLN